MLKADADNTPIALAMAASTILARLAAGTIVAATPAEIRTLLALATQAAYTQTYATAARTVPVATSSAVATTAATLVTPAGYTTTAQADAIPVAINAIAADLLALKKVVNALIDDLQANALAG